MKKYDFAFIVHSRDRTDLPRKYPILRYVPNIVFDWITLNLFPIIVSNISGAKDIISGKEISGIIVGIPMTATQLLENRDLALKKIIAAVNLAKIKGAKHIGLGAMTASLSKGGKDVIEAIDDVHITTGRTYTAKNITDYILRTINMCKLDIGTTKVAIVGAAGGIGSGVAISLAKKGIKNFVLIDLERKLQHLTKKIEYLENNASDLRIQVGHQLSLINDCKIVVAATNSPEIVIRSSDISSGSVIINDAQPSDIDPEIIKHRKDVLVIEGGVLHTKSINCHFNMGLQHKNDIFSCLAEVILLSSTRSAGHYSIDDFDENLYNHLSSVGDKLGFELCMQNYRDVISDFRMSDFINK